MAPRLRSQHLVRCRAAPAWLPLASLLASLPSSPPQQALPPTITCTPRAAPNPGPSPLLFPTHPGDDVSVGVERQRVAAAGHQGGAAKLAAAAEARAQARLHHFGLQHVVGRGAARHALQPQLRR